MSRPMNAREWRAAMEKWGVNVEYFPGWETRHSAGDWSNVFGILNHHTGSDAGQGSDYDRFLFVTGRSDLPAPLCNASVGMDGTLTLGATGNANHAGSGSAATMLHVRREDYDGYSRELTPAKDSVDGNAHYYGIEVKYDGGQPMTAPQYETLVLANAAIHDHHRDANWTALSSIGHREHTNRKWDPGQCDLAKFRRDVKARLEAGPPGQVELPPFPNRFAWASYNVGNASDARVTEDLLFLGAPRGKDSEGSPQIDGLSLQEAGDRRACINAFLKEYPHWTCFSEKSITGSGKVPILWNTLVMPVDKTDCTVAVKERRVGRRGAGTDPVPQRAINRVRVMGKDEAGKTHRMHVCNTHMIPSVTRSALFLGPKEKKARMQHYRDHIAAICAVAEERHGAMLVTADWNAEPDFELLNPMESQGFRPDTAGDSRYRRTIDFIMRRGAAWKVTDIDNVNLSSDHNAVFFTYQRGV